MDQGRQGRNQVDTAATPCGSSFMLAYNLGDCHAFEQSTGGMCPEASEKARSAARPSFGLPELLVAIHTSRSVLQQGRKSPNIRVSLEVIRGIPVSKS